jgi:hypothetical protein
MALAKKNSSFDALNIVLNVQVTPFSFRRFCSTCLVETNSVLVVPTLRMPRSLASRIASPTPPLELTIKPTAPTPSTSLALASLKEPQDLTLHLCLLSSRSPPRQCSRFHHRFLLVWIFAVSQLSNNPKSTRNSSILLLFLTIPLRHVGPCMVSRRRNALSKSSLTPRAFLPRHTLEFGTITNSQHLNPRSVFFFPTTLSVASKVHVAGGWTNSLLTKNDLRFLLCGLSRLVPTSRIRRS